MLSWCCLFVTFVLPADAAMEVKVEFATLWEVQAAFIAFEQAIKAGDADKIWSVLDSAAQKSFTQKAAALIAEHEKSTDAGKQQLEKLFGLTAAEIAQLKTKPQLYGKSKRFLAQWHDLPGSIITGVGLYGEKATVKYTEEDGDKEEIKLNKEKTGWKIVLTKVP